MGVIIEQIQVAQPSEKLAWQKPAPTRQLWYYASTPEGSYSVYICTNDSLEVFFQENSSDPENLLGKTNLVPQDAFAIAQKHYDKLKEPVFLRARVAELEAEVVRLQGGLQANAATDDGRSKIFDRVVPIVSELLAVASWNVRGGAAFEDLGADSLDCIELTMALEEEFEIEISMGEAESVVTVGDAVTLIHEKLKK